MIDHENRIIYIDNSTLSTIRACKEKGRLAYVKGYRPNINAPALAFGHAMHTGFAAYYDALAGGYRDETGNWIRDTSVSPLLRGKAAFLRDIGFNDAKLPVELESEERRSIERGLGLIEAYIWRYRNEPYENVILADGDGRPAVEIGFYYDLTEQKAFDGHTYKIRYCGFIDRLMLNRATGRPVVFELKNTSQGLSQYILQCKPNHQITGYIPAANDLLKQLSLPHVNECVWDCVFVSSRQADMAKAQKDRFWMYGIDVEKDFKRQTTMRSQTDIDNWQFDTICDARDYVNWLFSGIDRWPRNTGSCHSYGGCQFRNVCSRNGAQEELDTNFHIKEWNPAERIKEGQRRENPDA